MNPGLAASWTEINRGLPSTSVRAGSVVIAPSAPSNVYVLGNSVFGAGRIFKSTDGAESWKPISTITRVSAVIVDPRNSATLYVRTPRGLLKSTNAGDSWTSAAAGLPSDYILAIAIDPLTPAALYAVIGGPAAAIYKTTNGGETWNRLNAGLPANTFIGSLLIDPATPSKIYTLASVPQTNGPGSQIILTSSDGGESWSKHDPGLPRNAGLSLLGIAPTSPSTIYARLFIPSPTGPPSNGIVKSVDGGETWTPVDTGLPAGAMAGSLVIDPKNPSIIYLIALFPFAQAAGILKSTDGGTSWKAIDTSLPANTLIQSLVVDPVTSSTLYILVDGTIYKSTDGGIKWSKATNGLTAIEVPTLAMNRGAPATLFAGVGDSVFRSMDSGASWDKLFGFQLTPSSAPSFIPNPFPSPSPAYPQSLLVDFTNPNVLYATTARGNGCFYADNLLFKTTDGGVSWTDSISPDKSGCVIGGIFGATAGLKALDPADPNTVYLAESDDEDEGWWLLRSRDGGASWNSIGNFPGNQQAGVWALAIDPANSGTLYAGLDDTPQYSESGGAQPGQGGVFKSSDGGASWSRVGLKGAAVRLLAIDPADSNVIYASTEGNYGAPRGFRGLFKSTDAGVTWSPLNNGLSSLVEVGAGVTAIAIDPANSNLVYVGTAGSGVFKSADGGANWIPFRDGLTNQDVRALIAAPGSAHTLFAGTSGGVFKIVDEAP